MNSPTLFPCISFSPHPYSITKPGASAFYYQIVGMLYRKEQRPNVIFASPHIPNPAVYLELIPSDIEGERVQMTSAFTPVSQEKFLIDLQAGQLGYYNGLTQELHTISSFAPGRTFHSFVDELGNGRKNLIYCNSLIYAYQNRRTIIDDKMVQQVIDGET